jgi:hypothetical protein
MGGNGAKATPGMGETIHKGTGGLFTSLIDIFSMDTALCVERGFS